MNRVPHVFVPGPWDASSLLLPELTRRHLGRVLRLSDGSELTYTDGAGRVGHGELSGDRITRGDEQTEEAPGPRLAVAVAAPKSTDRARFVVEKLAELGVDELLWLETRHGEGRTPRASKAAAWAVGALEQSRGSHLMEIGGPRTWSELPAPLLVATPGGRSLPSVTEAVTVAVGPEAGFADEEVPGSAAAFGLGPRILRVETAAVVAATLVLDVGGRLQGA